jgi:hypothetical protein
MRDGRLLAALDLGGDGIDGVDDGIQRGNRRRHGANGEYGIDRLRNRRAVGLRDRSDRNRIGRDWLRGGHERDSVDA